MAVDAGSQVSESERLARLREQAAQGEHLPESIARFVGEHGGLESERVKEAKAEWLRSRSAVAVETAFPLAERLFYLTALLVPHCEKREGRAMLETSIDLLSDERHRHVLRCMLARLAAEAGEAEAAQSWVDLCDPRPLDLPMDTAYRYAVASIATAERAYERVVGVLGMAPGDVPLAARDALGSSILRANALAGLDREEDAVAALRSLAKELGGATVDRALDEHAELRAGARCWSTALHRDRDTLLEERDQLRFSVAGALITMLFSSGSMVLMSVISTGVGLPSDGALAFVAGLSGLVGLYVYRALDRGRRDKARALRSDLTKLEGLLAKAKRRAELNAALDGEMAS